MRQLLRFLGSRRTFVALAVADLVANCLIVVTGALVRLSASGLGCPTWPRCTTASYVTTPEMGLHGVIEFGNRMLTFVLLVVAAATLLSALAQPRDRAGRPVRLLAALILVGIPFQGVIGGITVLTQLNPFVVALHLLLSGVLICAGTVLVRRAVGAGRRPVAPPLRWAARLAFLLSWVAVWLGTVVTGSGPHSGAGGAVRTGFDIAHVAKVHAASVWVLVAVTVFLVLRLRTRAALALLVALLAQGAIGYAQYALGVPRPLVLLHMLGMTVILALATNLVTSLTAATPGEPARAADRRATADQKSSGSMAAAMNSSAR